jgi:hypothetical protein
VVSKLTVARNETFLDILKSGAADWKEQVLEFLRTKNLLKGEKGFEFGYITWALKDREFFYKVI